MISLTKRRTRRSTTPSDALSALVGLSLGKITAALDMSTGIQYGNKKGLRIDYNGV